jgi:hypothetical protein
VAGNPEERLELLERSRVHVSEHAA